MTGTIQCIVDGSGLATAGDRVREGAQRRGVGPDLAREDFSQHRVDATGRRSCGLVAGYRLFSRLLP